jgi:hypothetical protein
VNAGDSLAACRRLIALLERTRSLRSRARLSTDDSVQSPVAEFAQALLKMRVAPGLEPVWPGCDPVHVVLFGGTNTGKSTVLNVLLGRSAAGMNVLARFSQHPEAYRPRTLGDRWLTAFPTRFDGYERFDNANPPRQSDDALRRDGYRPRFAVFDTVRDAAAPGEAFADGAVAWDAPDFSTEEALTHLQTVLDVAALADIVVMTVSDESYADDRGHALVRMLGESGVRLFVVANKFPDATSPALLDDLAETLRVSARVTPTVRRFGQMRGPDPEARLRLLLESAPADAFRRAVGQEAARGVGLKRETLAGAIGFIETHWQELVRPLAEEAELTARWSETVGRLTREFVLEPYRRDYLEGVRYADFHRALAELMRLLQVPGVGPALDVAGRLVRWPGRMLARALGGVARGRTESAGQPPERAVLDGAIDRWLIALKGEAELLAGASPHPAWAAMIRALDEGGFRDAVRTQFDAAFAAYQAELESVIQRRADTLYARLKESPRRLNALRAANLVTNVFSIGLVVKLGGLNWWDAVLGPAVVGLNQSLVERGFGKILDSQRDGLKQDQLRAVTGLVSEKLEGPALALFRGVTAAGSLGEAERDFAAVREAVARKLAGGADD